MWIRVASADGDEPGTFGAYRLQARAIGDTCLLHVRHGEILRTFPLHTAAEFEASPAALGSIDLNRDAQLAFTHLDILCYADDLLVLCTDAIAEWAIASIESGQPPQWGRYWEMEYQQWQAEIDELRQSRRMRYDDATLVLLRVAGQTAELESEPPTMADSSDSLLHAQPILLPRGAAQPDWSESIKEVSEQVAGGLDRLSGRMLRGFRQIKDKAAEKYRQKFGPDKK